MKITLCGSTRFQDAFRDWDVILTKAGHVVYTLCRSGAVSISAEDKRRYDLIHLKKITESDAILVLNVDGYYGDSVTREIEWARMHDKAVYWLIAKPLAGEPALGVSVWRLYSLFDGVPINAVSNMAATPEIERYPDER
jgi:hypothetical protein